VQRVMVDPGNGGPEPFHIKPVVKELLRLRETRLCTQETYSACIQAYDKLTELPEEQPRSER